MVCSGPLFGPSDSASRQSLQHAQRLRLVFGHLHFHQSHSEADDRDLSAFAQYLSQISRGQQPVGSERSVSARYLHTGSADEIESGRTGSMGLHLRVDGPIRAFQRHGYSRPLGSEPRTSGLRLCCAWRIYIRESAVDTARWPGIRLRFR